MRRYIGHIIRSAEKRVQHFLDTQIKDSNRKDYGAMPTEIIEAKPTIYMLANAVAVYCNEDSTFHYSDKLYEAMDLALDFVRRCQREEGSFDYPSCNFKSAADTSFCFKRLIASYQLLVKYEKVAPEEQVKRLKHLQEKYKVLLYDALESITIGGFHTPNHRWGISAALMQGANLFPEHKLHNQIHVRLKQYLDEGIDGNSEGEYAERSTGNYNAVVNNAMMAMYEESKDVTYLGYISRNLHMMLTYFDPDDTIFTQNSTRQDQGKADYPDKYFYQYLYMASLYVSEQECNSKCAKEFVKQDIMTDMLYREFDAAAHKIIRDNMLRGDIAPECLHIIMLHDAMANYEFRGYGFLDTYRKYYEEAGVLRVKTPAYGYSLLRGKSDFLFLKIKETLVYLKIGESIGSVRTFTPETLVEEDGEYRLESTVQASYYQPFAEKVDTTDWWKMDHTKRDILVNSELKVTVTVKELEEGLELKVGSQGLDGVPLRLQFCIPAGSTVENDQFYLKATKGQSIILRNGYVQIHHNDNTVEIGPGFGTHQFQGHYSGEEFNDTGYTIFLNEYTPFEKVVTIKRKQSGGSNIPC